MLDADRETAEGGFVPPKMQLLPTRRVAMLAAQFCPVWFVANYAFNLSLGLTSVSSNTILSTTSSLWTLVLGLFVLKDERFNWGKLVAVTLTIGGVTLVSLEDQKGDGGDGGDSILGDVIALFSAVAYAVYTVLLRLRVKDDEVHLAMFFGFVGLFNFLFMWPFLPILHFTGIEPFALPPPRVFGFLLLNGLVGTVLSDLAQAKAVLLTSPLIATVAVSLTVPLAFLSDYLFQSSSGGGGWGGVYILGGLLVLAGFLLASTADRIRWLRHRDWRCRPTTS